MVKIQGLAREDRVIRQPIARGQSGGIISPVQVWESGKDHKWLSALTGLHQETRSARSDCDLVKRLPARGSGIRGGCGTKGIERLHVYGAAKLMIAEF